MDSSIVVVAAAALGLVLVAVVVHLLRQRARDRPWGARDARGLHQRRIAQWRKGVYDDLVVPARDLRADERPVLPLEAPWFVDIRPYLSPEGRVLVTRLEEGPRPGPEDLLALQEACEGAIERQVHTWRVY